MLTKRDLILLFSGLIVIMLFISYSYEGPWYGARFQICQALNPDKDTRNLMKLVTSNPLPVTAIARRVWHKHEGKTWQGLQLPVLISQPLGRLGNVLGEYATLYAIGRIYGTTTRLHPTMKAQLINNFPNITIELVPGAFNQSQWIPIGYLTFINHGRYEAAAAGILGAERFMLTGYPFEIQLFNTYRQDIIREFTFSKDLQDKVKAFWVENKRSDSEVIVGFHVRRTDYVNFIKMFLATLPEQAYYQRAMDYYKKKFPKVRFVVASDEMDYVKKAFANYTNILFTPGNPRELDMAILASSNHSIMTVGSFGFWCSYLAGGEVVYPNLTTRYDYQFQKNWYDVGHLDFFTPLSPH
ncbi:galactoside alpha-(1,2)-fucosyltransferase 2-like isoform X1 [Macrobrachium nipponense]|uniref:galactoside alpha-(1,2)-fucosyltransferase 2-like isoform X1 n=1 Tax=Macrobrachium nipponense TaxID=159736 RepID=UPI0030C826D6